MPGPKILLLDIETAPNVGYTWGKWEQNVIEFAEEWYILSVAYQWYGGPTHCISLPQYGGSERRLLLRLRELLDEADIIVAQNGDAFDIKKINTRLLIHRISPPSPYRSIDTLKIAKQRFAFTSNKLDDIGATLDEGRKIQHRGFEMWKGCMAGRRTDWRDMVRYNKQDVELLGRIYKRFIPWMTKAPNASCYGLHCPRPGCGGTEFTARGWAYSQTKKFQRFQCKKCHGWMQQPAGKTVVKYKT